MWNMNQYNKHYNLPYSVFGSIVKGSGNRPLKLGQFFNFGEFSLSYWLKLPKSMSFDKRNGLV